MPSVTREDGVQISWEARGDGPPVLLCVHWYAHPRVLDGVVQELARDHLVVTYDARGTGDSSPVGPYDLDTDADDLAAVLEEVGRAEVVLGWGDGAIRAARAAKRHPDLISGIVAVGGNPYAAAIRGTDSPLGSPAALEAFERALRTNYRSTVRGLLRHSSLQMSEAEMRARVEEQLAYCPQEVALARFETWTATDGLADTIALCDQIAISVLLFETDFGPPQQFASRLAEMLPDADVRVIEDGPVSRPDLTADAVRGITAPRENPRPDAVR